MNDSPTRLAIAGAALGMWRLARTIRCFDVKIGIRRRLLTETERAAISVKIDLKGCPDWIQADVPEWLGRF